MHRSRSLLQKAVQSVTAKAPKATKDATKAAAVSAPHHDNSPPPTPTPPYIPLYHHKDPSLFSYKSRSPGTFPYLAHHVSSAFDTFVSLCSSQESRDRFLLLTALPVDTEKDTDSDDNRKDGVKIIDIKVLGFSDMGVCTPLALFNDLDNPLFEKHPKFNINEFRDGCAWSLQQFHRTQDQILLKVMNHFEECRQEFGSIKKDSTDSDTEITAEGDRAVDMFPQAWGVGYNYDFLGIAAKNPESLEHDFLCMTTPEMVIRVQQEAFMNMHVDTLLGSDLAKSQCMPIQDETNVMNVAILSVRVKEIYPPAPSDQMQNSENDPDAPLEDDSLLPHRDNESNAQVVTQVEVLYELQESVEKDGKSHVKTKMMVGKFEACLDGDPNGDDVRWRLASHRHAFEFM